MFVSDSIARLSLMLSFTQKLVSDRRAWFTEEIGKGVFPESMQAYYDFLKGPDPAEQAEAKDDGKGKKGKKDKKDKKEKKGKKVRTHLLCMV